MSNVLTQWFVPFSLNNVKLVLINCMAEQHLEIQAEFRQVITEGLTRIDILQAFRQDDHCLQLNHQDERKRIIFSRKPIVLSKFSPLFIQNISICCFIPRHTQNWLVRWSTKGLWGNEKIEILEVKKLKKDQSQVLQVWCFWWSLISGFRFSEKPGQKNREISEKPKSADGFRVASGKSWNPRTSLMKVLFFFT